MIVKFDALNRFEKPLFSLCNPNCKMVDGKLINTIGILSDTADEELVLNFADLSEFNFTFRRIIRHKAEADNYTSMLYRSIQNKRYIYIENIGFFVITNVAQHRDENGYYKSITAQSCEKELANKKLPYVKNGVYAFNDLISLIMESLPKWTLGTVANTVSAKSRTFEDLEEGIAVLTFLRENMQDKYECIFDFDIINRIVHVHDQNNYVKRTSIHLSMDDVLNNTEISEDASEMFTAISVLGDNELNIIPVNPIGTNTIYNFDYYLDWMSAELKAKVLAWKQTIANNESDYYDYNLEYYEKLTEKRNLELDNETRVEIVKLYKKCYENLETEGLDIIEEYNNSIVEAGGSKENKISTNVDLSAARKEILNRINTAETQISTNNSSIILLENELLVLLDSINAIRSMVAFNNFTEEEYDELSTYISEGNYTDEYTTQTDSMSYAEQFAQAKVLYDRAKQQLDKISKPTQEFSADVENFLFVKKFAPVSEQIETGSLIYIDTDIDISEEWFLNSIVLNYSDTSLQFTFGNRYNKFNNRALYEDLLGSVSSTANSVEYIKSTIYPIKKGKLNEIEREIESSRTLTKNNVFASVNEDVIIDETGYTGKKKNSDGTFDNEQLKITHNNIVFTDDAWGSIKTALGKIQFGDVIQYGLNADIIIGKLITGETLSVGIRNADGTVRDLNSLSSDVDDLSEIKEYLTFDSTNGLIIGNTNDKNYTQQTSYKYSFMLNGVEVAYLSGVDRRLYINSAELLDRLSIGSVEDGGFFDFISTSNGLGIKWRGVVLNDS